MDEFWHLHTHAGRDMAHLRVAHQAVFIAPQTGKAKTKIVCFLTTPTFLAPRALGF